MYPSVVQKNGFSAIQTQILYPFAKKKEKERKDTPVCRSNTRFLVIQKRSQYPFAKERGGGKYTPFPSLNTRFSAIQKRFLCLLYQ